MEDPPRLILLTAADRASQDAVRHGELIRVTHGAAVSRVDWERADTRTRQRIVLESVVTAVGEFRTLSHRSAALLWGLPDVDRPDRRVHVTDPLLGTGHSGRRVVRHAAPLEPTDIAVVDGRRTTTLLRTVVDVARSTSYENVVAVFDHVLHHRLLARDDIASALGAWPSARGITRARKALAFADPLTESPGESVSRVRADEDGFAPPVLQQQFVTPRGRYRVDFWWPRHGVVGEFDGLAKYDGVRSVADEKHRHNALAVEPGIRAIVRWGWIELRTPGALQTLLRRSGLPTGA